MFKAAMQRIATESKKLMAKRLKASTGFRGRLGQKKRADGKPLGGSIVGRILRAKSKILPNGFDTTHQGVDLAAFHGGRPGQQARPIIGLTTKDQIRLAKMVGEAVKKQGKKMRIFK